MQGAFFRCPVHPKNSLTNNEMQVVNKSRKFSLYVITAWR